MTQIGVVSPPMQRRIVRSTILSELQRNGRAGGSYNPHSIAPISVRNVSAHKIPSFGLMQVKEVLDESGYRIYEVDRPFNSANPSTVFLVNDFNEIAAGEPGSAQLGPHYTVQVDSDTIPIGARIGWKVDSFLAGLGSLATVIGIEEFPELELDLYQVVPDFSVLYGTVATEIPASMGGEGTVTTTSPSVTYKAKTIGGAIAVDSLVAMWPHKGIWLAIKVC